MWNIYANNADLTWIVVSRGYTLPTEAAAAVEKIRADWPDAKGFMIGMEVWRAE